MSEKTILHVSDLHFGWPMQPDLAEQIMEEARELDPDLVVVTGDLTQRARANQYRAARQWLEALPQPQLVVPGNHDVPLFHVLERLRSPLRRYRRYISPETEPVYRDDGLLVVGLSSARGVTIDEGWLLPPQLARVGAIIGDRRPGELVAVAIHHHFLPVRGALQKPIREAEALLAQFEAWGVDLVLCGHSHRAYVRRTDGGLLLVQAGTATSTRGKGEDRGRNNYFVIAVTSDHIDVTLRQYDEEEGAFLPVLVETYPRGTPEGR